MVVGSNPTAGANPPAKSTFLPYDSSVTRPVWRPVDHAFPPARRLPQGLTLASTGPRLVSRRLSAGGQPCPLRSRRHRRACIVLRPSSTNDSSRPRPGAAPPVGGFMAPSHCSGRTPWPIGQPLGAFPGSGGGTRSKAVMDTGATGDVLEPAIRRDEIAIDSRSQSPLAKRGVPGGELQRPASQRALAGQESVRKAVPASSRPTAGPRWRVPLRPLSRPQGKSSAANGLNGARIRRSSLADLGLQPSNARLGGWFRPPSGRGGRTAARRKLADFIDDGLHGMRRTAIVPALTGTSRLSPHLRFGEISPRQVWHAIAAAHCRNPELGRDARKFLTELTWRDFCLSTSLRLPRTSRASSTIGLFDRLRWSENSRSLKAWQKGHHRLPDRRCRACGSSGGPAGCTTGCA